MAELLVVTLLMAIILTAGSMLFVAGQNAFSLSSMRAELSNNARQTLQRISYELQESGRDSNTILQTTIFDGAGVSNTDILRFSIPLCVCGISPIDTNGNVSRWGAPLQWGQAGCSTNYPVDQNGKVDICHYPPGNPNNPQSINVSTNAVKAHLAHGDYIGNCGTCNTNSYNRSIEYLMNANNQLIRRVLDVNGAVVGSAIFAQRLADFQASFNAGQTVVTVTVQLTGTASQNRTITVTNNTDVLLRN